MQTGEAQDRASARGTGTTHASTGSHGSRAWRGNARRAASVLRRVGDALLAAADFVDGMALWDKAMDAFARREEEDDAGVDLCVCGSAACGGLCGLGAEAAVADRCCDGSGGGCEWCCDAPVSDEERRRRERERLERDIRAAAGGVSW